jgi:AcrR family transcriptional regulator
MVVRRDPEATRLRILEAAFQEVYRNGFRAASIDQILAETGLTKGALYHHFPNKAALGYAIVDELLTRAIEQRWIDPLADHADPIAALIVILEGFSDEETRQVCELGCPLNNLAQEMSPIDDTFRQKIAAVFQLWRGGIAQSLRAGQTQGCVRADVDCDAAAMFFVSSAEGACGLAKASRDGAVLEAFSDGIRRYLESLRPVLDRTA